MTELETMIHQPIGFSLGEESDHVTARQPRASGSFPAAVARVFREEGQWKCRTLLGGQLRDRYEHSGKPR